MSLRRVVLFGTCLAMLAGCRCTPGVVKVAPEQLVATPMRLELQPVYVGQQALGIVSVVNEGGAKAVADVSISAAFTVDVGHLELVRGESAVLTVTFSPTAPGPASATLRIGTLEVQVEGTGLEVPACLPSTVCVDTHFDTSAAQCREAPKAEGTACETSCVTGACTAGTCLGALKGCDDGNACTLDACDEVAGCSHSLRTCPQPTAPCQVAKCDDVSGCGADTAPDGTLCGPDDCLATQVQVCIVGQCVTRPRPDTGRCANRWVPTSIPGSKAPPMVWDAARKRIVQFEDWATTWEWDGTSWVLRFPAMSPPARWGHAMAWDGARQRTVLFGGNALSDTWEWDGTTWVQRMPATSPSARAGHAMAWDPVRQRVVLFGGDDGHGPLSDTWEWNGSTWIQRAPPSSPSARRAHTMAWDPVRQRVLLFGGSATTGVDFTDTWEWNGTTWALLTPAASPSNPLGSASWGSSLATDEVRQRLVLFGPAGTWEWDGTTWLHRTPTVSPGQVSGSSAAFDAVRQRVVLFCWGTTWEWDGTTWSERARTVSPPSSNAIEYDAARHQVVLFGGMAGATSSSETWAWDGTPWVQQLPTTAPPARTGHRLAYDAARQRIVLFGGTSSVGASLADTWEWDGTSWAEKTPLVSPPARQDHALAYDVARQRVVLFGGRTAGYVNLSDTWEWDGTSWTEMAPVTSPSPRRQHALAWDGARNRVLLFGGTNAETWEWDGVNWALLAPAVSPPLRVGHAMAWDAARQRVVLHGGEDPYYLYVLSDTWDWDGTVWVQRTPTTTPGGAWGHGLTYDAVRQRVVLVSLGETWVLLP